MKQVVVAPLNWGLGHATRCIPIINALQKANFTPVIASDGQALDFLNQEFPELESIVLPSYKITYGKYLKLDLWRKLPTLLKVRKEEKQFLKEYTRANPVVGIISDNRFGAYVENIPSVYMTHQVNVKAGIFTPLTSMVHHRIIRKFDECWIPDEEGSLYSGKLSKTTKKLNQKYIGILSRMKKTDTKKNIDILIVLSGPEPNRSRLETKFIRKFKNTSLNVYLIRGKVEKEVKSRSYDKLKTINFLLTEELQMYLNKSKMVVCRSGYSSIMDLIASNQKAILIPTKGQSEQAYLGKFLSEKKRFVFLKEGNIEGYQFNLDAIACESEIVQKDFDLGLFGLFHGE